MYFSQNSDQQQVYYPNNGNMNNTNNNLQQLQAHHLAASSSPHHHNSRGYSPSQTVGLNESASTLIQGPPILQSTLLADHQYQDNTINGINDNYDRHSSNELYSNNNNHNHHHLQYDDSSIVGSATDL